VPPYRVTEAETRYSIIPACVKKQTLAGRDPQLKKAGWNVQDRTQVGIEIPVSGYDTYSRHAFINYCLLQSNILNAIYENLSIKFLNVDINSLHYSNIIARCLFSK